MVQVRETNGALTVWWPDKDQPVATLKAYWRETPYTPDFWDGAVDALLNDYQERGYYAADVTWQAKDGPSGRTVRILVDRGKAVRLRSVRFEVSNAGSQLSGRPKT